MQSLPDGWTIYLWMVAAAGILIGAAFLLRWGFKNNQFDEDIKYVVFDDDDVDKMSDEDFKKYKEVMKKQVKLREDVLRKRDAQKLEKQNEKR
ncbi:MAG: hypothetical protein COB71_01725 [Thiotrichales bacterium]|nr:MAG: hypothetical protein COB71_01725 [Thiotrichales bacterium]